MCLNCSLTAEPPPLLWCPAAQGTTQTPRAEYNCHRSQNFRNVWHLKVTKIYSWILSSPVTVSIIWPHFRAYMWTFSFPFFKHINTLWIKIRELWKLWRKMVFVVINYAVALPVMCVFINSVMRHVFYLTPNWKTSLSLSVRLIRASSLSSGTVTNSARNRAWRGPRVGARAGTTARSWQCRCLQELFPTSVPNDGHLGLGVLSCT